MKFDFCIGNPPYQEDRGATSAGQVYNYFMDSAYKIADKVELITPARFLTNSGRTPKAWNQKMLQDEHFKILKHYLSSKDVFPDTEIKGGVCIHYRDNGKNFGKIEVYSNNPVINNLRLRVDVYDSVSISTIMYPYSVYSLNKDLFNDFPDRLPSANIEGYSLSNEKILTTNIFDLLCDLFIDECDANDSHVKLWGRQNNKRIVKAISGRYVNVGENYDKWKVILPKSNGSGIFGEELSTPMIGTPMIGYTQSYLGIGSFCTEYEAEACLKYVKGKFARAMLGILKATQDNPPEKWKYVPLQDFTSSSDIDWRASIADIDRQLYRKYKLSDEEIAFIETHVKEMA